MKTEAHTIIEVLQWVQDHNLSQIAEVVGRWVWLTFQAKPDEALRSELKAFGFRWVPRRGRWAHNCGHPSRSGVQDPRQKYPVYTVEEMADMVA